MARYTIENRKICGAYLFGKFSSLQAREIAGHLVSRQFMAEMASMLLSIFIHCI